MWLRAISWNVCGVGVGPTGRILQEPSGNMHFTCVGIVTCISATTILNVQRGTPLHMQNQSTPVTSTIRMGGLATSQRVEFLELRASDH